MRLRFNFRSIQADIAFERSTVKRKLRLTVVSPSKGEVFARDITMPLATKLREALGRERLSRRLINGLPVYAGTVQRSTYSALKTLCTQKL